MLCERPYGYYACGACGPCRLNRQRMWAARITLEALCHKQSCFVTLTFDDKHCPSSLDPRDLQLFMKRLRNESPRPLRFFGVGEYGSQTFRPHYHVALFGLGISDHVLDAYGRVSHGPVAASWKLGFFSVGELNEKSASYIAKYATKRLTRAGDPRLESRYPEFARMSLRPYGIGANATHRIAAPLLEQGASRALVERGDVPHEVRINGRKHPLGSYLRRRLREDVGWGSKAPREAVLALAEQKIAEPVKVTEQRRKASALSAEARIKISSSKRSLR